MEWKQFLKKHWLSSTRRYSEFENFFRTIQHEVIVNSLPTVLIDNSFEKSVVNFGELWWRLWWNWAILSNHSEQFQNEISRIRGKIDNFHWTMLNYVSMKSLQTLVNIGYCKSPRCSSIYHLKTRKLWLTRNRISINITRTDQIYYLILSYLVSLVWQVWLLIVFYFLLIVDCK